MRRRRKPKRFLHMPATPLEGMDMVDGLQKLSDEALRSELKDATNAEAWLRGMSEGFKGLDESLVGPFTKAAGHARIVREVIALMLFLRQDKKDDGPSSPGGYL